MPIKLKPIAALAMVSFVLSVSGNASASDWVFVGESENDSKYYIDIESINQNGDIRTAWVKIDESKNNKVTSYETVQQSDYDCRKKTANLLYNMTKYRNKPTETDNYYSLRGSGGSPIPPDSMADAIQEVVCAQ